MTRTQQLLSLAIAIYAVNSGMAAELRIEPDKENVVSSRLVGSWQLHSKLNERLTGKADSRHNKVTFRSDPSVAKQVPQKYVDVFIARGMRVYMAGYFNMKGKDLPFLATTIHGNSHIMFWLERNGERFGNSESFNVMLTVAKDSPNDLLFIGGDFNNQPFSAFERVKATKKDQADAKTD
ncbi:MAG: hypothetical protein CMJ78_06450 [Planctomycetaceae bacterium]|nr:hypothetical protein [Planctomycetaceae bacterium]